MELPPFLLDRWLAEHEFASPPIRWNLASSAGPQWTLHELLTAARLSPDELIGITLGYAQPEGSPALRAAIGGFLDVDPDWVVVTTGASEALSILLCLAATPGATAVAPAPGYPSVQALAQAWGMRVRSYRLDRARGFAQRAADVLDAVDETTRIVYVASPHNPTGSVMPPDELRTLAAELPRRNCQLVVDEVYHPLLFGAMSQSAATTDNAVAVGDMSKALSLPGLRIGWIIERDATRRARIVDARSYFTISGSPLTERVASEALLARDVLFARLHETVTTNLAMLANWLDHDVLLDWVRPTGGSVAFPWFVDGRDSRPICRQLAAQGVLVVPGDCFGHADHLRIGLGAPPDDFRAALAVIAKYVGDEGI
ncbi:aminotransferase [Burkholderia ubonensis]|uniref:pyridoxal phosphate-dependent aminotransferase n=1 Tax=Burkholderia ubonensis TaxID=101571 RepID=UPI000755CCD4|nr:pyridoxal phosphate-dependent aminotransferase [Burkholderia ubonensis]KVG80200.1 aminotransferase [Burkholderia ubonensis]